MHDPAVGDYLRPTAEDEREIYRVVGTDESRVTVLRVTDADGRRAHTGEVVTIPRTAVDSYEQCDPPDATQSLGDALTTAYWSVVASARRARERPVVTVVGVVAVGVGSFGDGLLPDALATGAVVAGCLVVAAVVAGCL